MEIATQAEFDEILSQHNNIQYVDAIFTDYVVMSEVNAFLF
jgi:hypothetical protein